jgi:hypothetical protein
MSPVGTAILIVIGIAFIWLACFAVGTAFLFSQTLKGGSELHCRYFDTRQMAAVAVIYAYAPSGLFGRRSCPFWLD